MNSRSFYKTLKQVKLSKKYVVYSVLYGLTTLIIPLAVQFLVNNLALAGLWVNIVALIVIIGVGLTFSLLLKYCQFVLNEYLQRELFEIESKKWQEQILDVNRIYFVEIFFALKSFSKSFTSLIEISLVTILGLLVILTFHPAFLLIAFLVIFTLLEINNSTKPAIETSINESNEKYLIYKMANEGKPILEADMLTYLTARHKHFQFLKKNTIKIFLLYMISQLLLLGGGTILVQRNELSIGQLVAAEIILSGIMISLNKLPVALEALYDFETSSYKLKKAREK